MKFAIFDGQGYLVQTGMCPDDAIGLVPLAEGQILYEGEVGQSDMLDVATHTLIEGAKPAAPSIYHDWDDATRQWVPNIERMRATKRQQIEAERDRRIYAPIVYDGKTLDGFRASQDNLKSKLETIAQREALGMPDMAPQMLVWRDAENVTHTFPNQAAYKAWLGGWAIALEERGTLAYAWSWARKAALDALTTFEAVQAFEVSPS